MQRDAEGWQWHEGHASLTFVRRTSACVTYLRLRNQVAED